MVEIPDTGGRGMINSAYSMENGEQVLIDTLSLNFGIPIHHYVEIDFNGFQQLVDTIGGVSLWIPNAVRDEHSGLFIQDRGCVTLQGEQALQFAGSSASRSSSPGRSPRRSARCARTRSA
jgi:LCP family protein required for cell wall assembly